MIKKYIYILMQINYISLYYITKKTKMTHMVSWETNELINEILRNV